MWDRRDGEIYWIFVLVVSFGDGLASIFRSVIAWCKCNGWQERGRGSGDVEGCGWLWDWGVVGDMVSVTTMFPGRKLA